MNGIEFSIYGPAFEDFNRDINNNIQACMQELFAGNFQGGEISSKISIDLEYGYEKYPTIKSDGEVIGKEYKFKKPVIEHKITLTLKKRHETKGKYNENLEIKRDGDKFILLEVKNPQMSLEEMEGEE